MGEHPCRSAILLRLQSNFIEITNFGIGVLLQICCIFLEHFFLRRHMGGRGGGLLLILFLLNFSKKRSFRTVSPGMSVTPQSSFIYFQMQSSRAVKVFFKKRCSQKFCKINRKTLVLDSLLIKFQAPGLETFFHRTPLMATSVFLCQLLHPQKI